MDAFFAGPGRILTNLCITDFSKLLFLTLFFVLFNIYLDKSILSCMEFTKNNYLSEERVSFNSPTTSQEQNSRSNNNKPKINKEFIEWFVGISDAESNFLCRVRKNKEGEIIGFEFLFRIALHVDDLNALEYIKATLGCGRISSDRNTYVFIISRIEDIKEVLIPVFEQFPLNTKKYLDYLAFKKAFFMYINRNTSNLNKEDLFRDIIQLKDSMNDKRINFDLPENHIRITGNYLIGLLEGDGSFYLSKNDMTTRVLLIVITQDRILLEKIREFLLNQLDEYSCILGSSTKLINIYDKKAIGTNKPISTLEIYQIDYLVNILIPYFDTLEFKTKKILDYLDFKTIASLIFEGKHLLEDGKELIIKLGDSMNNSRLSTNPNRLDFNAESRSKLNTLIKSKPLISVDSEGRAMIINESKYIRSTYIIQAVFLNGSVSYFTNGISCAKALHVSNNTITRRLNDGQPVRDKNGLIIATIKRIKAYSPKN